jgi:hypothetical protein
MDPASIATDSFPAWRQDCVHISGLEVEGRHPRALMESALLPLQQVIGLEGPAPDKVRKKPVYRCAINDIVCNLRKPFSKRQRGGTVRSSPTTPR